MIHLGMYQATYLIWGIVAHLVADFLLQTHWQAVNKVSLKHPAAWLHGFWHFVCLAFVFPLGGALVLAFVHMLVDTRVTLVAWGKLIGQTWHPKNPLSVHVAIWRDQTAHVLTLALYVYFCVR